jgi:hypothetical protein
MYQYCAGILPDGAGVFTQKPLFELVTLLVKINTFSLAAI